MIIDNRELITRGKLLRTVRFKEEWDQELENPSAFLEILRNNKIEVDIFTFVQNLPQSRPRYQYYREWDSVAAITITTYDNWLKTQVSQNSRKKIGLAIRKGVRIELRDFDDELVRNILEIYHETPMLQGKPNRQYKTDFQTAKKLNSTYINRAQFVGAYFENELIGYIKLVWTARFVRTMGILVKMAHRDKGAMNLLIAKAVEICAEKRAPYLVYSQFNYGKRGSETLRDFKKNLGFESIIVPRYYVPLTMWGAAALRIKLHKEAGDLLPRRLVQTMLKLRSDWYERKYSGQESKV